MGIPHNIDGWAFIVLAAASASRPLSGLVRARRRVARFSATPAWVWSGLIAGLASLAVPGIVSRRRGGRIEKATFSTTRLSTGYDEEEVDVFLDKVIAVLSEGGQPDQAELRSAHFTTTRLRPGYVMQDVDSFLHEIARASRS
jgi:DivIVA domain-containing protein